VSTPDVEVRATRLAPAFDLLAACTGGTAGDPRFLFEREGLGVAGAPLPGGHGWSTDATDPDAIIALGRNAQRFMQALAGPDDLPGTVAVGRFPFAARADAWMQVPARLARRTTLGETWLVELTPTRTDAVSFAPGRPTGSSAGSSPGDPFGSAQVEPHPSAEAYAAMVAEAVARIRSGAMRKVVLARTMRVAAGRVLDPVRLAHRLRAVDPHAFTFVAPSSWTDPSDVTAAGRRSLVGASPELLVSRLGSVVRSTPLAGSAPRAGDPEEDRANADALFASAKNREEHAIVVEAIAETLGPTCLELTWDPEPVLLETANVWHLATRFQGIVREPAPNVVELVAALHPTPAVCGTPTEVARSTIDELEPFDRGGYAGPVGWMDARGDGEWAIALRCAELAGDRASLFAGAGIVAASEPDDEVDETDRKFRAFLDSLRWG
jgi:isochorismate synthase